MRRRVEIYKELFTNLNFNHNQKILVFKNFEMEYKSFYDYAVVYDASHYSFFYITGKDSIDFLHRISTNDLLDQADYTTRTTLFLNEKGRIIDKIKVLKFSDHLILIASPDNEEKIERWIERYAVMDDIKAKPIKNYIYLKIIGKKNEIFFTLLFGDQLKNLENGRIYKYFGNNFQCWVIRDEIFNQNYGYEILIDDVFADSILKYIYENLPTFNCEFIGSESFETIRIEQGVPEAPNELNDAFNPYDVNLINFVSFTKGCYIGQEVIARLDTYDKVRFNFSGFKLERDYSFEDNLIYKKDGTIVGELTSKTYSPKLQSHVALGLYSRKLSESELKEIFVKEGEEFIKAQTINLPMVSL